VRILANWNGPNGGNGRHVLIGESIACHSENWAPFCRDIFVIRWSQSPLCPPLDAFYDIIFDHWHHCNGRLPRSTFNKCHFSEEWAKYNSKSHKPCTIRSCHLSMELTIRHLTTSVVRSREKRLEASFDVCEFYQHCRAPTKVTQPTNSQCRP
jgi:hypothetical protein